MTGESLPVNQKSSRAFRGEPRRVNSKFKNAVEDLEMAVGEYLQDPALGEIPLARARSRLLGFSPQSGPDPRFELFFHRGILAALAHVAAQDSGVLYDEIVRGCGPRQILAAAQGEDFDLAHLQKYGWATKSGRLKRLR